MSDSSGTKDNGALRLAKRCAAIVLITIVVFELSLQGAALFVTDRSTNAKGNGSEFRILAIGDSHTFGALVEESESYPARLQHFLEQDRPGDFLVINKGVPGFSSGQVRSRLMRNVARDEPDLVLFWVGVNDSWNITDIYDDAPSWRLRLGGMLSRLRLYKMITVWHHDRRLERVVEDGMKRPVPEQTGDDQWRINWDGVVEEVRNDHRERQADDVQKRRVEENYEAMVLWLKGAGICAGFVEYPMELGGFAVANQAMRRVAQRHDLPIVDSNTAMKRVPKTERILLWGAHPNPPMYTEIARDVAKLIREAEPRCR